MGRGGARRRRGRGHRNRPAPYVPGLLALRDGRGIVESLTRLVPTEPARRTQLLKYLGDVTRAVVFGSAATAVIQGVIVGVGFAIVGLPSPVVFGVLGTIAAFLPAGAGIVPPVGTSNVCADLTIDAGSSLSAVPT